MSENGVLVVNLGTPDSLEKKAVARFLTDFLSDPRVVDLPRWLWLPLLKMVIIPLRKGRTTAAYRKIWLEQGSPLMVHTGALVGGMKDHLDERVEVRLAMRYGQPDIRSGLIALRDTGVKRLLILPIYPQYSATTSASVFDEVTTSLSALNWEPEQKRVKHYFDTPGWIHSVATSVRNFQQIHGTPDKLLFSMHGIPKRYVDNGDPYELQCLQSFTAITEVLKIQENSLLTYQSRVGREPWLQPYTDEVIKGLAASGARHLQVISPGFSVDCLETLEEIAIRYKKLFIAAGGEKFEYIPALNDSEAHIGLLVSLTKQYLQLSPGS